MIDTTHPMYQPDKRAKRTTRPVSGAFPPDIGNQSEREAWMRARQAKKRVPKRWEGADVIPMPPPNESEDQLKLRISESEGRYERLLVMQAERAARHPNSIIVKLADRLKKGVD